jgi:glycosyltransferase involved in cell wall biosynthesis
LIGRYHPLKDHATFLGAAKIIRQSYPETVFLLVGRDCTPENAVLQAVIDSCELEGRVRLLGELSELEAVFPALDILVSSSISEGFPTAVGEAMGCGVPCVVTDVGDSGFLVDSTGLVVPAKDPAALATACMRLLAMDPHSRAKLGKVARQRIAQQFAVEQAARQYEGMYREITTL